AGAVSAVFGLDEQRVLVREGGSDRPWGAVGCSAVLGSVRLYPRSGGRFRLGRSAVGRGAVRGYGDPKTDAARTGAFRVNIAVPDAPSVRGRGEELLRRLVGEFVPGHVDASIRVGGPGFVVGQRAVLAV